MEKTDKGYFTNDGYMGWIPELKRYVPFASQDDYESIFEDEEDE